MYWIEPEKFLGTFKQNSTFTLTFQATDDIPEIKDFKAQCGCTELKYNPKRKTLTVKYSSGILPKHLPMIQRVVKLITVFYEDGTTDILKITGTKTK